jgi:hypothetical protein
MPSKATKNPISKALKGIGIDWVRQIDRTYDVAKMRDTIREALTTPTKGPKVIVASSECMLNKQRREKPLAQKAIKEGRRVEAPRFGVDEAICTGDHACIRLSGCPSLSLKRLDDPLARRSRRHPSTNPASAAATAARWRMPPSCAPPSTAPMWSITPAGGKASAPGFRARVIRLAATPPRRPPPEFRGSRMTVHRGPSPRPQDPAPMGGIIKLALLAVGGQGGGVLTGWIEDLARANGYAAQATSVAGVAQRTGATVYYVEMAPAGCRHPGLLADALRRGTWTS